MATTYGQKRRKHNNSISAVVAAILILSIFLTLLSFFYTNAENEAVEKLHLQTKQIKDDLTLQIKSDRENLVTMANFAAKLYADGEDYDIMFASFEAIGLFSNIGILNRDNTFVTKAGTINLEGKISFDEEVLKGRYVSGRVKELTIEGKEIVRSAVPILYGNETVGILYGVVQLDTLANKYNAMAKELDAQLFVYSKDDGKFVIDTINKDPGELSQLKTRKYNNGYSYEQLVNTDKGFTSFKSISTGEDLYVHYSTLEDINWGIMLARYESQVFAQTHKIANIMFLTLVSIVLILVLFFLIILRSERNISSITKKASEIRKQLLEINQKPENIDISLKTVASVSHARSAMFVDSNGDEYIFINPKYEKEALSEDDRKYLVSVLFRYAMKFRSADSAALCVMNIIPDKHLLKTNPDFYSFLKQHSISHVNLAGVSYNNTQNDMGILFAVNAKNRISAKNLIEEIAVCFSIAIYNKNHFNQTYTAATTDALTGVFNRVAYKKDIIAFDEDKSHMLTCIYIDVNELHLRNNRYGHAAGDEMLIYIANSLKSIFYGHNIYRMGGDEFLVFICDRTLENVQKCVEILIEQLDLADYHIAIGISHRTKNIDTEDMVREAEIRMYEAKAQYYQTKEQTFIANDKDEGYIQQETGIKEIDTMLSVLKEHYNGIYRVSLDKDSVHRILMPSYLGYNEDEKYFSKLFTKYVNDSLDPDFHRAAMSFLNYDAIKRQLAVGSIPKLCYKKTNGESITLSVYNLDPPNESADNTLWVFAKD